MLLGVSARSLTGEGECRAPASPPPGWCLPTSLRAWIGIGLVTIFLLAPGPSLRAQGSPAPVSLPIYFRREIANIEYGNDPLRSQPPKRLIRPPLSDRSLWFGQIRRRFPGEQLSSSAHDVAIAVEYSGRRAVRAWCDSNLNSDQMSPELIPFTVPFQLGDALFRITSLDEEGRSLSLVRVDTKKRSSPPIRGQAAPDFAFQDWKTGREVRLADYRGHPVVVYFWAGWCGSCEEMAPSMRALYDRMHPRGVEILGVSYDTDSTMFLGYLEHHPEPWPISFTGRRFWENPIGRLYLASAAGAAFLVDASGRLDGIFYEPEDLN